MVVPAPPKPSLVSGPLPVYLINLDADTQRLEAMRHQLDTLGIAWERVPAVEGSTLSADLCERENRRALHRRLSFGEIGCLHSHVAVWRRVAAAAAPAALILEDDVLLSPQTAQLVADGAWVPQEDCIVRLEAFSMRVILDGQVAMVQGRGLHLLRSVQHGAAAYILTRRRAQRLVEAYGQAVDTADRMMFASPRGQQVYQLSPAVCIQQDIYAHGRRRSGGDSRLQAGRVRMDWGSWREPQALLRRLTWKLCSVCGIVCDLMRGYAFRQVPFSR